MRNQLPRGAYVLDHPPPRLVRIALLNRLEDRIVLADVLLEQRRAAAQSRPRESARKAPMQIADRQQLPVSGGLLDDLVKEVVGTHPIAVVGPARLSPATASSA